MRAKHPDENSEENTEDVRNTCASITFLAAQRIIIGVKTWSLLNESKRDLKEWTLQVNIF